MSGFYIHREDPDACEEIGEHRSEELVDDTDGVLIYRCNTCGAEWWQDDED